jgi:Lrp/AsnC family leucine-responsive transcriptional regulator
LEVNPQKLGYPITAIVRMSANEFGCARLSALTRDWPEVLESYRVTGSDSVIMRVVVSSVEHLETFIDRIGQHGSPTTSIVLSTPVSKRALGPAQTLRPLEMVAAS